ncbi:MAG TPA: ferredoxin [Acidimicrobiales bacterium]|nr:ferredoxin [Acidimicrobiales bacterium]
MTPPEDHSSSKEAPRFRIVVDRDLCQGHGVCEAEAPDVFELERKATTITVLDESPPDRMRAAVEAAVKYCPTHALSIEEIDR